MLNPQTPSQAARTHPARPSVPTPVGDGSGFERGAAAHDRAPQLLPDERTRLAELETAIKHGFVQIGLALEEIFDRGLDREYGTRPEYCQERWNIGYRHAMHLIAAAKVGTIVPVKNTDRRPRRRGEL